MIVVDTTVWVDLFKGKETTQVQILEALVVDRTDLCTCGVILAEVLQGIRNRNQYRQTRAVLENLVYLPMIRSTFIHSADIYRTLRSEGITIRNPIDCMIASVCLENKVALLHNDRDFTYIAQVFPLQIS